MKTPASTNSFLHAHLDTMTPEEVLEHYSQDEIDWLFPDPDEGSRMGFHYNYIKNQKVRQYLRDLID